MIIDYAILSSEQEIPMDNLGLAVAAPAASRGQLSQADGCGTGQEVAQGLVPGAAGGRLASMKHIGLNVLRCQGFRFYDEAGAGDWFSRDLVQKRPVDFTSNLNSVPMMGKREPEAVQQSDNNPQFVVEEAL